MRLDRLLILYPKPDLFSPPGGAGDRCQREESQRGAAAGQEEARPLQERGERELRSGPAGDLRGGSPKPGADDRELLEVQALRMVEAPASRVVTGHPGGIGDEEPGVAQLFGGRELAIGASEVQVSGRVEDGPVTMDHDLAEDVAGVVMGIAQPELARLK